MTFQGHVLMIMKLLSFFTILSFVDITICIGLVPNIYCGLETCYDVLGINRDEFAKDILTKTYRKLARQYHPDRVKDKSKVKESEEIFVKVSTAYETLKDDETRKYYDYYLDNPEERYYNYYHYYRLRTIPKVDIRYVILVTVIFISVVQYLSASQKFSEAVSYAATQHKFRNTAMDIARERKLLEFDEKGKLKKKQKNGSDVEEVIRSIITENIKISGGYKKATVFDTFAFQIILFPITLKNYLYEKISVAYKQYKGLELSRNDKLYLIRKNLSLSYAQLEALDDEIEHYLELELWKKDFAEDFKKQKELEEKEKMLNSGRYKQYRRFMKKNAGNTISFLEE